MRSLRRILCALTLCVVVGPLSAENVRVLLPVTVDSMPGANGSIWYSEVWVDITTDAGVRIVPLILTDIQPLRRGSMRLPVFAARPGMIPGQFLHVTREELSNVHLNLRIRDLSRQAETFGTEVPVVPEDEFRDAPLSLLPVPVGDSFRSTVRIYGTGLETVAVRIRVIGIDEGTRGRELYAATMELAATTSPYLPSYAEIPLHAVIAGAAMVRVVVEPVAPGTRFWAFASTTHNETQHVTTISPR